MSQLLAIRDRIKTIKNLRKVTNAMELVTQTRINKVRSTALNARYFGEMFTSFFIPVMEQCKRDGLCAQKVQEDRAMHYLVCFCSQKGFCGNFNDKALGKLMIRLAPLRMHTNVEILMVGRRQSKWANILKRPFEHIDAKERSYFTEFAPFVERWIADIQAGKRVEVYFVYNELVTILQQNPIVKQVFPALAKPTADARTELLFDPDGETLFPSLLKAYFEANLAQVYWDSLAGEYCSRLLTMKKANDNATLIIDDLQLNYNKTRQSKITQELSEIISAFDVLKLINEKKENMLVHTSK